jgi:hypothetical protein
MAKAHRVGIKSSYRPNKWSDEDMNNLKEYVAQKTPLYLMAQWLDRTETAVRHKIAVEALDTDKISRTAWEPDEVRELKRLCAEGHNCAEMGRRLNRPRVSVLAKCRKLQLTPKTGRFVVATDGSGRIKKIDQGTKLGDLLGGVKS